MRERLPPASNIGVYCIYFNKLFTKEKGAMRKRLFSSLLRYHIKKKKRGEITILIFVIAYWSDLTIE